MFLPSFWQSNPMLFVVRESGFNRGNSNHLRLFYEVKQKICLINIISWFKYVVPYNVKQLITLFNCKTRWLNIFFNYYYLKKVVLTFRDMHHHSTLPMPLDRHNL